MATEEQNIKAKRVVFQEKPIILNTVSSKSSETTSKPDSENEKNKERKERNRPPTKVVVRRLPPTMTLETFINNVSPLPEHDFIYFVQADMSLGPNAFSRAYINFVNMEDLLTFYEQFDSYVFMDSKGNEYPAVVEFAPFQRVPKKRSSRRRDPKVGTLKDDPAFVSFVASLKEKNDASSMKQASAEHLLALTTENSTKKDVSTPLLEFIKQRRAERQRMKEEKKEERKRKELERKRIKEEERKRRKDSDSVLKVLRNPDHDDKIDVGKMVKDRDRNLLLVKKREEERKIKEKDRKDRRDIKTRDSISKPFRDERPKQPDNRMPRKVLEEQHRKPVPEREVRHGSDYSYNKETESRKMYPSREAELKKGSGDKFSSYSKDRERSGREIDARKNFKESDMKRSEKYGGYIRDTDYRRNYGTERKITHSYSESDARKKVSESKPSFKVGENSSEKKLDASKSQNLQETDGKKWELLGAKPKRKVSQTSNEYENTENDEKIEDSKEGVTKTFSDSHTNKTVDEKVSDDDKTADIPEFATRRRNSLEYEKQTDKIFLGKPKRQISLDSETFLIDTNPENAPKRLSKSQEFETSTNTVVRISRRNSLDSGDHKENTQTESVHFLKSYEKEEESELKIVSKIEMCDKDISDYGKGEKEGGYKSKNTEIHKVPTKLEQKQSDSEIEGNKKNINSKSDGINDSSPMDNKRDPRAERRIRNKDRPSIEIYRPGMGRLSIQRREREKNTITSSIEHDSPSNSPSPTPSSRLLNNSKVSKTSQELRSMTFKRSDSLL